MMDLGLPVMFIQSYPAHRLQGKHGRFQQFPGVNAVVVEGG